VKTPYERALAAFQAEYSPLTFDEVLTWHLLNGFVFSRPDFFVLGRPVVSSAPYALLADPSHHFPSTECDAWLVYLAAGNTARMWEILPWPLPLIGFERRNEGVRFFPSQQVARLTAA